MSSARSASLDARAVIARDPAEGDSTALESVVIRHRSLVTHIVYRTIGSGPDSEDVCQEVFLRVCQGLPGFRFESKMSTWIARVAYNTSINYLHKKREVLFGDLQESGVAEVARAPQDGPDELSRRSDLAGRLEAEIRQLPAQFRTILTLFHLEDMGYREIGEVMDMPEGTVKSYLFRARRQLRQRLMGKYKEGDLWP